MNDNFALIFKNVWTDVGPYEKHTLSEFTDEEIIDIIKDAIKHHANPKHDCYRLKYLSTCVYFEFGGFSIWQMTDEEHNRINYLIETHFRDINAQFN